MSASAICRSACSTIPAIDDERLPNLIRVESDPVRLVERFLPLVRLQAFEARTQAHAEIARDRRRRSIPRPGCSERQAFWRDLERAVDEAEDGGRALSVARFSFEDMTDRRAYLDAARLLSRLIRNVDFACREQDGSILAAFTETDLRSAHVVARRLAGVLRQTMLSPDRDRGTIRPTVTLATLKATDNLSTLVARVGSFPTGCRRAARGLVCRQPQGADMTALPIDMVSDVVCPWCFIGKRRLEKAIALKPEIPVAVRFHPYFLNPWVPREGISREEYLVTKFGSVERYNSNAKRVAEQAAGEGLIYACDKIKRQPNTLDCHRLILWAGDIGNAAQMKQRLMDLYFTEGGDLTDPRGAGAGGSRLRAQRRARARPAGRRSRRRAGRARGQFRQGGRHRRRAVLHHRRRARRAGRAVAGAPRAGDRTRRAGIRQPSGRGIAPTVMQLPV